ncbi:class F sortase [Brachybacterium sp. JHP9]|uniref:Class F sortase n=1 Tax=Brachybacterium equifaecis TaxID=2910770 RepID=A0ABT0R382_9MICO|nr:class F sortase [Brachybacterium equifaecis]MCL6424394.1 class F sortase [Brachybacterium equifaecis]
MTRRMLLGGTLVAGSAGALAVLNVWPQEVASPSGSSPATYDPSAGRETLSDGRQVVLEDPISQEQVDQMDVQPSGLRMEVPAAGIFAEMRSMHSYLGEDGVKILNPPTSEHPYWVRDWADPVDGTGMVVVATHSVRGLPEIPGSRLIDIDAGRSTLSPGDVILIGDRRFEVTVVHEELKGDLAGDQEIWADIPGKLLIVTCLQRSAGKSQKNIVIEAMESAVDGTSLGSDGGA